MLTIKNFDLHSVTVGSKHVRAFSIDNNTGVIADHVLGICGIADSPFYKDFYATVGVGPDGVEMKSGDDNRKFLATRDRLVLSEHTAKLGQALPDEEGIFARAKYLMPNVLSFMNKPKAIFLGMVWQYTESEVRPRERWRHPAADDLFAKTTKFSLVESKEHPSEMHVRLTYRRKLGESFVTKGKDDFINIILNLFDNTPSALWPSKEEKESDEENPARLICISIDVQRMLNPRVLLYSDLFDEHLEYCNKTVKPSIQQLLEKIGFESE